MYIANGRSGYNRDGEQWATGKFLIVCDDPFGSRDLFGIVRSVKLTQFGNWMSGRVNLGGFNFVLSGTYGSDGLPHHLGQYFVDEKPGVSHYLTDDQKKYLIEQMVKFPEELRETFWKGGGWNTGGAEMPSVRDWAVKNIKLLSKPIPKYVQPQTQGEEVAN